MKQKYLYSIGVMLMLTILFVACKKERGPRLIVTVIEKDGTLAPGALVHAWYSNTAGQPGSVLNEPEMNQESRTGETGVAEFDFKYSAVLDVDVIYYKNYLDSLLNPVVDTLYGHRVVKIEAVRQKSKENNYRETVEVQ